MRAIRQIVTTMIRTISSTHPRIVVGIPISLRVAAESGERVLDRPLGVGDRRLELGDAAAMGVVHVSPSTLRCS